MSSVRAEPDALPTLSASVMLSLMSDFQNDRSSKARNDSSETEDLDLPEKDNEENIFGSKIFKNAKFGYLAEIRKTRHLFARRDLDIKPTWDTMKILSLNSQQIEMYANSRLIVSMMLDLETDCNVVSCLHFFYDDGGKVFKELVCAKDAEEVYKHIFHRSQLGSTLTTMIGLKVRRTFYNNVIRVTRNDRFQRFSKMLPHKNKSSKVTSLIGHLRELYLIFERNLAITGKETMENQKKMRRVMSSYRSRQIIINEMQARMRQASIDNIPRIKMKEKEIKEYHLKLMALKERKENMILNIESQSQRIMGIRNGTSQIILDKLAAKRTEAVAKLEAILSRHLIEEKPLRHHRYRLQSSLASCIAKYDAMMLETQEEIDDITEAKDQEFEEFIDLKCLYNEQKKAYLRYKKIYDREEEARQIALEALRILRATKVIQKWWRAQMLRLRKYRKMNKKRPRPRSKRKESKKERSRPRSKRNGPPKGKPKLLGTKKS